MNLLYEIKSTLLTILPPSIWDIIDMAALAYLIYKLIMFMKETRAMGLLKGIIIIFIAYFIAKNTQMKALAFVLDNAFNVGILAILILFQPELRRSLEKVGHSKITSLINQSDSGDNREKTANAIRIICDACEELSASTTGALIVFERETKLGEQIASGTILDAVPSTPLFGNIFYEGSPMHDGAVIIRDGIVHAAACYLPRPQKDEIINKSLGARHRAAIGMSENSDAIIVVVSEETGTISIAENGELTRGFSKDKLMFTLNGKLLPDTNKKTDGASGEEKTGGGIFGFFTKKSGNAAKQEKQDKQDNN